MLLVGAGTVYAEFPNLKLPGSGQATAAASLSELTALKDSLVRRYLETKQTISTALEQAASAFGISKEILDNLKTMRSLKAGQISDTALTKAREAANTAITMLKEKMQTTQISNLFAKNNFSESAARLADGIQKLKDLGPQVKDFVTKAQTALRSSAIADKLKFQNLLSEALNLSSNVPLDLRSGQSLLSALVSYATNNKISLPNTVQSVLKAK
jgi:hypothetical protein